MGLASNLNGSVHGKVDKRTHNQLTRLLRKPKIKIFEQQPQIQEGSHNCGLFALAFCTSLANGEDVCSIMFNQSLMRKHLEMCFEKGELLSFPKHLQNYRNLLYFRFQNF